MKLKLTSIFLGVASIAAVSLLNTSGTDFFSEAKVLLFPVGFLLNFLPLYAIAYENNHDRLEGPNSYLLEQEIDRSTSSLALLICLGTYFGTQAAYNHFML